MDNHRLIVRLCIFFMPPLVYALLPALNWLYPIAVASSIFGGMVLLIHDCALFRFKRMWFIVPIEASALPSEREPGTPISLRFVFQIRRPTKFRAVSTFVCWKYQAFGSKGKGKFVDYTIEAITGKQEEGRKIQAGQKLILEADFVLPSYRMGGEKDPLEEFKHRVSFDHSTFDWIVRVKLEMENGDILWQDYDLFPGGAWRNLPPQQNNNSTEPLYELKLREESYTIRNRRLYSLLMCKTLPYLREEDLSHHCVLPEHIAYPLVQRLQKLGVEVDLLSSATTGERHWAFEQKPWETPTDQELTMEVMVNNRIYSPEVMSKTAWDDSSLGTYTSCLTILFAPTLLYLAVHQGKNIDNRWHSLCVIAGSIALWLGANRRFWA